MRPLSSRHWSYLIAAIFIAACAGTPERVQLDPQITGASTGIGAGHNIKLVVTGANTEPTLIDGQFRFPLQQPATETVKGKLREGLLRHGFNVDDFGESDRQLMVSVLRTDNTVTEGTVKDTMQVDVSLQLTATTSSGTLTRTFNDSRMQEVTGDATVEEVGGVMNQSLAQVLARALSDGELLRFLGS
jgi:uncharacterized lipoprotein YajG